MRLLIMKTKTAVFSTIILLALTLGMVSVSPVANANSDAQAQIDALNAEINKNQGTLNGISQQADTLQNKVNAFNAEIAQLQAQIDLTNLQIQQSAEQIEETKRRLEKQKRIMQENAKVLYKQGEISTLEVLASSDNFSEFVNRQEYLEKVKENVNKAAREVIALKDQLEAKVKELQKFAAQQENQRTIVGFKREEQAKLLEQTRGEEGRYQAVVSSQRAEKERLESQQRAAYEAAAAQARNSGQFVGTGGTGSYPWADKPYPCWDSGCADPWGLYYRECVSYTAWKVADSGRYVPHFGGRGNANQWPSTTSDYEIPSGSEPRAGSVAIDTNIQPNGHSMYVQEVLGGGRIRVSEYNFAGPGLYSERIIPAGGLTYIYF